MPHFRPAVLVLAGHDPCGGAGIQADIETLVSHQCHPVSVITCLTEQDSQNVRKIIPQNPQDFLDQALYVIDDIPIKAIKIGLLGNAEIIKATQKILQKLPNTPVVLDPILAAGGGMALASDYIVELMQDLLLPLTTVLTPNSQEARKLTGLHNLDDCGLALLNKGCDYVLITGTHENTTEVCNRLYFNKQCVETYPWTRLPHSYHGSGCTLASSIAALIAEGLDIVTAVGEAQEYTWDSLQYGFQPGKGQHLPNRIYWIDEE